MLERLVVNQESQAQLIARLASPDAQSPLCDDKPLLDLVDDYRDDKAAKRGETKHILQTRDRQRAVVMAAGWTQFTQINEPALLLAVDKIAADRKGRDGHAKPSQLTKNYYMRAVRELCNWAVRKKLAPVNPLAGMQLPDVDKADKRHTRRTLLWSEVSLLLRTARRGPTMITFPGPKRAIFYQIAMRTGLRRKELSSLTSASFHFVGPKRAELVIELRAKFAKNKRHSHLSLPRKDVPAIRDWIEAQPDNELLFPASKDVVQCLACREVLLALEVSRRDGRCECGGAKFGGGVDRDTAEMVRRDMESCGLPYKDLLGDVFDLHACRHQFVDGMFEGGNDAETVRLAARHSGAEITTNTYHNNPRRQRMQAAADKMPDLPADDGPGMTDEEPAVLRGPWNGDA